MSLITLAPLRLSRSQVHVEWRIEPASPLYLRNEFTLDFGDALDPRTLPLKLWWTLVLLALHSHWNLLRPCRVCLPVTLPAREVGFWLRLLDTERVSLERHRGTTDFARTVDLECTGPLPESGSSLSDSPTRYGTAFSGGKDSLLQTGLLCELSKCPLLVNTNSPMPLQYDHSSAARTWVLQEIIKRTRGELVEVKSDFRRNWENTFSRKLGYLQSVNEITDTNLYAASLLAVAAARGVQDVSLAAEFDLNEVERYEGRVSQYYHYSYSPIILLSLSRLFGQWGMSLSSLLTPLTTFQVQALLRRRYESLAELQISCWAIRSPSERYCNRCAKCLRIAAILLALGDDPAELGLDVDSIICAVPDWDPADRLAGHSIPYSCTKITLEQLKRHLPPRTLRERLRGQSDSLRLFERMMERCLPYALSWWDQYHPQYLKYLVPELRDPLDQIFRQYWPDLDPTDRAADIAMIDEEIAWVTQPLDDGQRVEGGG